MMIPTAVQLLTTKPSLDYFKYQRCNTIAQELLCQLTTTKPGHHSISDEGAARPFVRANAQKRGGAMPADTTMCHADGG